MAESARETNPLAGLGMRGKDGAGGLGCTAHMIVGRSQFILGFYQCESIY